jgi:DNA-binding NarL/FixJ family response regulator
MIRVAVVEDDVEIRKMVSELIQSDSNYLMSGIYGTAEEFLRKFSKNIPDVVILDIHLPGISGIECLKKAKPEHPDIQYIMFTVFEDDDAVFEALRSGATGYILKRSTPSAIFDAVQNVFNGGSPMSPEIARKVIMSLQQTDKQGGSRVQELLTPREKEILIALSKGLRYKEISDKLFISMDTVRSHIRNIYEKLQVNNRTAAVRKASL